MWGLLAHAPTKPRPSESTKPRPTASTNLRPTALTNPMYVL